jgi:DNA-directed RNA polymerase subunit RPC12/RpoP
MASSCVICGTEMLGNPEDRPSGWAYDCPRCGRFTLGAGRKHLPKRGFCQIHACGRSRATSSANCNAGEKRHELTTNYSKQYGRKGSYHRQHSRPTR